MQTKCSIHIGWFCRYILKNVLTISKEFKDWELVLPTGVTHWHLLFACEELAGQECVRLLIDLKLL